MNDKSKTSNTLSVRSAILDAFGTPIWNPSKDELYEICGELISYTPETILKAIPAVMLGLLDESIFESKVERFHVFYSLFEFLDVKCEYLARLDDGESIRDRAEFTGWKQEGLSLINTRMASSIVKWLKYITKFSTYELDFINNSEAVLSYWATRSEEGGS